MGGITLTFFNTSMLNLYVKEIVGDHQCRFRSNRSDILYFVKYMPKRTGLVKVTLKCVRVTIVAVEKAVNITYSECVSVALVIQHAIRMRRIVLSSVSCLAVRYISHYSIHSTILGGKLLNMKCVLIFCDAFCLK
jgi:hypothetical protein